MLAYVLCLLPLQAPAEIELPSGAPITLDGTVEDAEWQGAFARTAKLGKEKSLHFRMKRTGAWLAVGLHADRPYGGELMRVCVAAEDGSWVASVFLGIGQPSLPRRCGAEGRLRRCSTHASRPSRPEGFVRGPWWPGPTRGLRSS